MFLCILRISGRRYRERVRWRGRNSWFVEQPGINMDIPWGLLHQNLHLHHHHLSTPGTFNGALNCPKSNETSAGDCTKKINRPWIFQL